MKEIEKRNGIVISPVCYIQEMLRGESIETDDVNNQIEFKQTDEKNVVSLNHSKESAILSRIPLIPLNLWKQLFPDSIIVLFNCFTIWKITLKYTTEV